MTPQVKQRIEQIRRGEVPEGYKRTKAGIMPLDWCSEKEYKAKNIFKSVTNKKHNGEFQVLSATQDKGVIPRSQIDIDIKFDENNVAGYKKVDCGDFVISLRSFQGGIEYSEFEGLVSPAYTVLKPIVPICDGYYKAYLKSADYISRLNKGTYGIRDGKQVGFEDFGDMILHYPSMPEQKKIAEILSTQDKLIALKEKLIEEKKLRKKHIIHEILSQNIKLQKQDGSKYPRWETNNIATYLTSRNTKQIPTEEAPLMAFVADVGVVSKGERYDRSFLVKNDEKEYKRTELNDFIYSSNNLDVGSIGLNNYGSAVISVVYEIFSVNSNAIPIVISEIIQMKSNINKILRYRQGALYGQYRILAEDFLSIKIDVPTFEEQQAIAKIMISLEKEIELLQKDLDQEKQKKKALIQLLLTGIVRVN